MRFTATGFMIPPAILDESCELSEMISNDALLSSKCLATESPAKPKPTIRKSLFHIKLVNKKRL